MVSYAKYHKATDLKTIYSFGGSYVANMLLPVLRHRVTPHTWQTGSVCDKRARGRKRTVALSKKLSMQQWRQKQKHGETTLGIYHNR